MCGSLSASSVWKIKKIKIQNTNATDWSGLGYIVGGGIFRIITYRIFDIFLLSRRRRRLRCFYRNRLWPPRQTGGRGKKISKNIPQRRFSDRRYFISMGLFGGTSGETMIFVEEECRPNTLFPNQITYFCIRLRRPHESRIIFVAEEVSRNHPKHSPWSRHWRNYWIKFII